MIRHHRLIRIASRPRVVKNPRMNIQVAVLCDAATDDNGKLNLLGSFDTIYAPQLPAVHPQCAVALRVTFQPGEGITGSHLVVSAKVPGLDDAEFQAIAADAKENCPVSKALTGIPITLEASLT